MNETLSVAGSGEAGHRIVAIGNMAYVKINVTPTREQPMRTRMITLILCLAVLSGCASTSREYKRDEALAYYCVPGSALKRPVPQGANFPGRMLWDGGSCKHH